MATHYLKRVGICSLSLFGAALVTGLIGLIIRYIGPILLASMTSGTEAGPGTAGLIPLILIVALAVATIYASFILSFGMIRLFLSDKYLEEDEFTATVIDGGIVLVLSHIAIFLVV